MISGLLARVGRPRATHVPSEPVIVWLPHSRLSAALGRCACRECHVARSTREAPLRAAEAAERCRARMEALREEAARNDESVYTGGIGACAPPGDGVIDWAAVADEVECKHDFTRYEAAPGHWHCLKCGAAPDSGFVDPDGRLRGAGGKVDPYEYGSTD